MDSLKDILRRNRHRIGPAPADTGRLRAYIEKKHHFKPEIGLSPRRINVYAPSAAQASILRLDWANLRQLTGDDSRRIDIRIRKIQS